MTSTGAGSDTRPISGEGSDAGPRPDGAWSRWLLKRRFGGDEETGRFGRDELLVPVRDRILGCTALTGENVVLDVGCGDGFLGLGALKACPSCRVVLSDWDEELLQHARIRAEKLGLADRCSLVKARAESLGGIGSESIDLVVMRSVLMYVTPKQRAFGEFYRVLRPGGQISICEPIGTYFASDDSRDRFGPYDVGPVRELADKVRAAYRRRPPSGKVDPALDFDERVLLDLAREAGFTEVVVELRAEIGLPYPVGRWEAFLGWASHPLSPTLEEAMAATLSPAETAEFVAHLRPLVERQEGVRKLALAFLWGVK